MSFIYASIFLDFSLEENFPVVLFRVSKVGLE